MRASLPTINGTSDPPLQYKTHDFISAVTVTVQDEGIEFRAQDDVAGLCRVCLVFLGAHSPGDGPIGLRTIWIFFWNKVVF